MPSIVASVAQCGSVYNNTPVTLFKMRILAKTAKERDSSQLVVFPEAFIGGKLALRQTSSRFLSSFRGSGELEGKWI